MAEKADGVLAYMAENPDCARPHMAEKNRQFSRSND